MSLAVFIQPEGSLLHDIKYWKAKINYEIPNQPYTIHPPHLTMINARFNNEKKVIEYLSSLSLDQKRFQILIKNTNVFWNDSATSGHTIFFAVKKNKNLTKLQNHIAQKLKKEKKSIEPPYYVRKDNNLSKSFKKFGFPFIGDHWIPHFSVASIKSDANHPLIKEFLSIKKKYTFNVNQISLWRIDGDNHKLLKRIVLNEKG